jgi:hypothetical protein
MTLIMRVGLKALMKNNIKASDNDLVTQYHANGNLSHYLTISDYPHIGTYRRGIPHKISASLSYHPVRGLNSLILPVTIIMAPFQGFDFDNKPEGLILL